MSCDKIPLQMNSVYEVIRDLTDKSDIVFESEIYQEINGKLSEIVLNLAFFVFTTREHSSCGRNLDGNHVSCPVLMLYLKYNTDFQQTGIHPHSGNWNDDWELTRTIRNALNKILERNGFDNDFVSDHTFVFVNTRENVAFHQIGQDCTDKIANIIGTEAPGVKVENVNWNGSEYYILMRNKNDYKRVKKRVKDKVKKVIPKILANADKDGFCQDYSTTIEFGFDGVVPWGFMR